MVLRAARSVLACLMVSGALLAAIGPLAPGHADEGFFIGDSIAAAAAQTIGMQGWRTTA